MPQGASATLSRGQVNPKSPSDVYFFSLHVAYMYGHVRMVVSELAAKAMATTG